MTLLPSALIFLIYQLLSLKMASAQPAFTAKRFNSSLGKLVTEILERHFPRCEIILLQDAFFANNMNAWLEHFPYPYYSLTLDGKPFPDYTTWKGATETAGFTCSTIIATCLSFSTCRNNDSTTLFAMLDANGILLKERRSLLYIDQEVAKESHYAALNGTKIVKFSTTPISYQEQDAKEYTIPALNMAKQVLSEIKGHITIIRQVRSARNMASHSKKVQKAGFYETTTFSPNWIPGGTPVLRNVWSSAEGFSFPSPVVLKLTYIREGGTVRFCSSSMDLLPMFFHKDGDEDYRGIDGEMIKIFQKRFKLNVQVFEPSDKDFGKKGNNGWTGVIGYVVRKEADFGIGQITYTFERFYSGLKFTPAFIIITAVAVCPRPKLLPVFNTLIQPFDIYSWGCLIISTISVITGMQIIQVISSSFDENAGRKALRRMYVAWIQVLGPIVQRSVTLTALPRRWATLGLMATWLLTSLIVSTGYTSLLIGGLSIPARESPVTSPYDLVSRRIPFAMSPIVQQAIENSILPEERAMYSNAVKLTNNTKPGVYGNASDLRVYDFIKATEGCVVAEKLRSNYIVGLSQILPPEDTDEYVESGKGRRDASSRLYVSRDAILIGPIGWAMRSDMDFLLETYFDRALLQFRAQGLLIKTMQDFNQWSTTRLQNTDAGFKSLRLETIEPVFIIGAVCATASLVVFTLEFAVHRRAMVLQGREYVNNPHILP